MISSTLEIMAKITTVESKISSEEAKETILSTRLPMYLMKMELWIQVHLIEVVEAIPV